MRHHVCGKALKGLHDVGVAGAEIHVELDVVDAKFSIWTKLIDTLLRGANEQAILEFLERVFDVERDDRTVAYQVPGVLNTFMKRWWLA